LRKTGITEKSTSRLIFFRRFGKKSSEGFTKKLIVLIT